MAHRYTLSEAIDYICDHHTGEVERGQETNSENGLEEEVSEDEDDTEYNPDQELTDGEESSDEKDGHAEAAVTFKEWELILLTGNTTSVTLCDCITKLNGFKTNVLGNFDPK